MNRRKGPFSTIIFLLFFSSISSGDEYWNLTFKNGRGPASSCLKVQGTLKSIQESLQKKNGTGCEPSDEGDHVLFKCGRNFEILIFTKEMCQAWTKQKYTDKESQLVASFTGCYESARKKLELPEAVKYCRCVSEEMTNKHTEKEFAKLSKEQTVAIVEPIANRCMASVGIKTK